MLVSGLNPDVRIFPDVETLSRAVAQSIADRINAATQGGARFYLSLAGGKTPRALYRLIAQEYRDQIRWALAHIFWGDERYVPPNDSHSNYRMARENLLDHVAIPAKNVHPMPTDFPEPEAAAPAYERTLHNYFSTPWPHFDLILLGLGADGHTASLFPGSPALEERERWVVAARGPIEPKQRLTVTLPVLNHAQQIYFLVTGQDKAEALARAVAGTSDPKSCPAAAVRAGHSDVVWWADEAAARLLHQSLRSRSTSAS